MLLEILGAKAEVYMKFNGELKGLASIISEGLRLPCFIIEPREDPPYDLSGSCEAMGFEIWLENSSEIQDFNYLLKIETEHSMQESFDDKMYDLSPWLARFILEICGIDTLVFFEKNQIRLSSKREN